MQGALVTPDETVLLEQSYGWTAASFVLVSVGENTTFRVDAGGERFVVRRYRRTRWSRIEVQAELAWMEALARYVDVPAVIPTVSGAELVAHRVGEVETIYAAFEYVAGSVLHAPSTSDYFKLGQLMWDLHEGAGEVLRTMGGAWVGWRRPRYGLREVTQNALRSLLATSFLPKGAKARCERVAGLLEARAGALEESGFVHGDLHFGNVLVTNGRWWVLDFDECGFGPPSFDVGVVRFHARAEGALDEAWSSFREGYGEITEEAARTGAASRILFAMGKLPSRLDITEIARDPVAMAERYLRMVEAELETV